jgi:uncharacterized RDD family membrane protein YckC
MTEAAAFYLVFVGLPSLAPIAAARSLWARLAATAIMSATAAFAAFQMVTIDDGQAGLAVIWVPLMAFPLAIVLWIGQKLVHRPKDSEPGRAASASDRAAALIVDAIVLNAVVLGPLWALSDAKLEIVAGVLWLIAGTLYLALPVAGRGRTLGQWLVGLAVVDARSGGTCSYGKAVARSAIVTVETVGALSVLAPLVVAELASVASTGRSLTDRLLQTAVVTQPRSS